MQVFYYITELVEIYSNMKCEISFNNKEKSLSERKDYHNLEFLQEIYENLIRKLESDLRNH